MSHSIIRKTLGINLCRTSFTSISSTSTSTSALIRRRSARTRSSVCCSTSSNSSNSSNHSFHSTTRRFDQSNPNQNLSNSPSSPSNSLSTSTAALLHQVSLLRSALSASLAPRTEKAKERLDEAAKRWNELSGYGDILKLKQEVEQLESHLTKLRSDQATARSIYLSSISQRSNSQARITDLLSRKHLWTDTDLSDYTNLLRSEHSENRDSKEAEKTYEQSEEKTLRAWDELVRKTLERYHQEMSWSDKIRWAGTIGSWAVLGVNVLVFMMAIFLVEPYKRRALARTFETRLLEGEAHSATLIQEAVRGLESEIRNLRQSLDPESKSAPVPALEMVKEDYLESGTESSSSVELENESAQSVTGAQGEDEEFQSELSSPPFSSEITFEEESINLSHQDPEEMNFEMLYEEDQVASDLPIHSTIESWKTSSAQFLSRLAHSTGLSQLYSSNWNSSSSAESIQNSSSISTSRQDEIEEKQREFFEALKERALLAGDGVGLEEREKDIIVAGGVGVLVGGLLVTLLRAAKS